MSEGMPRYRFGEIKYSFQIVDNFKSIKEDRIEGRMPV